MSFLGSSSRSRTENYNTSANAPQQVDRGNALALQNIDGPISIESIDAELAEQLVALTNNLAEDTFMFSAGSIQEAYKGADNALVFGAGAFDAANSSINNALESSESLSRNVISFASKETDNTRMFSAGAIAESNSFARALVESNMFASKEAMGYVDNASDRSNDFAALALMSVNQSSERNAEFVGGAFNASFDAIENANKSETAKLSEKVLYGAFALAALLAFSRFA